MLSSLAASALALVMLVSLVEGQSGAAPLRGGHGSPARVVYVADELADEVFELFSAPMDGSAAPLRLSAPMPTGGDVGEILQVSGGRVLYLADALTNGVQELFVVADDGSAAPLRLSPPLPASGDVSHFIAGPDFALFLADSIVDGREELHRVALDGSTPPVVLAPGQHVFKIHDLSRDGALVLYDTLYSGLNVVRTDGSAAPVFLSFPEPGSSGFNDVYFSQAEFTGDGARVVFMATEISDSWWYQANDLWSIRLDGTQKLKLSQGPKFLDTVFQLSPDGSRALYTDTEPTSQTYSELVSVRTDGSSSTLLTPGSGRPGLFRISDDSAFCVFASQIGPGWSLRMVRLDGSQPFELLASVPAQPSALELLPGSTAVVFLSDSRVYSLSTPGTAVPVSSSGVTEVPSEGFPLLIFTPDSSRVLYRAEFIANGIFELWSARLDGSARVKLNPPLTGARDVSDCRVSSDGHALFRCDRNTDETLELFAAPLDGSSPAIQLNTVLVSNRDVVDYSGKRPSHRARLP